MLFFKSNANLVIYSEEKKPFFLRLVSYTFSSLNFAKILLSMKKFRLLILLLLTSAAASAQSSFNPPRDGSECANFFFKALLEEDTEVLNNILSDDFSIISFDGQQADKNMLSQGLSQGYITIDTGMLSGMRTRDYGDINVITGIWNVRGKMENNSFQNELSYMVIAAKKGGIWKITAAQLTPVR